MLPWSHLLRPSFLILILSWELLLAPKIALAAKPPKEAALPQSLASPYDALPDNTANNTPESIIIQPSEQVTYSSETAASVAELNV